MAGLIGAGVTFLGQTHREFYYTALISGTVTADDVGKAVTQDKTAANTIKLAGDGDEIIGRLEVYEDRTQSEGIKVATFSVKGGLKFPVKSGETVALGDTIQGAGAGEVKTLAVSDASDTEVSLEAPIAALGTAETVYVTSPIAGKIVRVDGVSAAANGIDISTVTVSIGAADIATLAFPADYAAGTVISDATPEATGNVLAAGGAIKVVTDGAGDGAGKAQITIYVEPTSGAVPVAHTSHDTKNRVWEVGSGYVIVTLD